MIIECDCGVELFENDVVDETWDGSDKKNIYRCPRCFKVGTFNG